jgi:hypothetical protein
MQFYEALGPPPHWVERVLQGAPGLLEPSAREQVETPRPTHAGPVERSTMPFAQSIDEQRTATVTEPPRPVRLRRPWLSRPRTMREGPRVAAEPAAAEAPVDPDPTARQALTVVRPRRRTTVTPDPTTPVPDPIVLHDRPPTPPAPPAATVVEQRSPSERPADTVVYATTHVHAASPARAPLALAVPLLAAPVPSLADRVMSPVREAVLDSIVPLRSDGWLEPVRVPLREASSSASTGSGAHSLDSRVSAEHAGASGFRHPWPELPPPVVQHDVDLDATLRAWDRERRLDREQAGL